MTKTLGYTRPLGHGSDLAEEQAALREAGATLLFRDDGPPTARDQPQLVVCLTALAPGGTLLVTRAARLRPSLNAFLQTVAALRGRGVSFRSLAEPTLDTAASVDAGAVMAALDGVQRELVAVRTRAGMERARARGNRPGRPSVMSPERLAIARELRRQDRSIAHIANVIGVSPSAVQRALAHKDAS